MIICPDCETELNKMNEALVCSNCSYKADKHSGIWIFNPEVESNHDDYNAEDLSILDKYEDKHFWFKHRTKVIKHYLTKYVHKNSTFIEIGAGTCQISKMLINEGFNVAAGDIHRKSLEIGQNYNIKNLYQFDLYKPPFKEEFEAAGLFDVIEHLEDDEAAILNIKKILHKKGLFILTVPAHKWLWSHNDVIARHKRRYDLSDIKNLLYKNGFKVLEAKNFFVFLIPLLLIRKVYYNRLKDEPEEKIVDNNLRINPIINSILSLLCSLEFQILKYIPCNIGGSIIIVAEKID